MYRTISHGHAMTLLPNAPHTRKLVPLPTTNVGSHKMLKASKSRLKKPANFQPVKSAQILAFGVSWGCMGPDRRRRLSLVLDQRRASLTDHAHLNAA